MAESTVAAGALLAQMRAQREFWVELDDPVHPGLAVKMRRPTEAEFAAFLQREGDQVLVRADVDSVQRYAVDWRGFTEAVLLGPSVGAADVVPFHAELWSDLVADRRSWASLCRQQLVDRIVERLQTIEADRKN